MAKGTSVGFASSVTQAKAAQAKKQRKAANIPATPAIKQAVANIRAQGKALDEPDPGHDLVRQCWRETVEQMKLAITDMRARKLREAEPKPVRERPVFAEFIQVVEDVEPAPVVKPSPLPAQVEVVEVAPLLLTDGGERVRREKQARRWNRLASQYRVMQSNGVIELPARMYDTRRRVLLHGQETDYAAEAEAKRLAIRQRHIFELYDTGKLEAEDFAPQPRPPAPVDFKQVERKHGMSYQSAYTGSMYRNRKG